MVDAVRQIVAGQLGRVFNSGLTDVKSALVGKRGQTNAPGGAMERKGKYTTNVLQYPFGVDNDPQQGHYILFNINVNKQPKLKRTKMPMVKEINKRAAREFSLPDMIEVISGQDSYHGLPSGSTTASKKPAILNSTVKSAYSEMIAGSTRLGTSIALYMPPTVNVSYTPAYNDVDIGGMAELIDAGANMFKSIAAGQAISQADVAQGVGAGEHLLRKGIHATLDTIAPGLKAISQIQAGAILSNKMELSFEGVNRRDFTYTFTFIPKSEQEAKTVDQIVQLFKFHSLPEYRTKGGSEKRGGSQPGRGPTTFVTGRTMSIPDTFDIDYMYRSNRNSFLNKISTCFCTGVQVAYGGDRYIAYDETTGVQGKGNPPQRTALTLNFKEMEIITRERINEGY